MTDWRANVYATSGGDLDAWESIVDRLPSHLKDVYYWPGYALLFEKVTGYPTRLFFYGDDENFVLNVFMRRGLCDLRFSDALSPEEKARLCDIATPYGYGGPVVACAHEAVRAPLWGAYESAFAVFCRREGIVAEFVRLHPLIGNHRLFEGQAGLYPKNHTVWVDLRQSDEEILAGMRKDHARSVRKAERKGVQVRRAEERGALDAFVDLYSATMERLGALDVYRFSRDFFEEALRLLGRGISLFVAEWEGRIVSAHLVIHSGDYIHNFLSGSDPEYWNLKADVLITYQIARWAKQQGYRFFHLGGGHAVQQDSLLHFKSGFSPRQAPYFMFRRVCDEAAYERLCRLRQASLKASDEAVDPVLVDYFPAYRA